MKNEKQNIKNPQSNVVLPYIISRCLSYLTMRKVRLFTPTMSGNIYVYKDCYGVKWLAYSDFPRKRCLYDSL